MSPNEHDSPNPGPGQGLATTSSTGKRRGRKPAQDTLLYDTFQELLLTHVRPCFPQDRTYKRFAGFVTSIIAGIGDKTLASTISLRDIDKLDWSPEYKVFGRCPWNPEDVFREVLRALLPHLDPDQPVMLFIDDTSLWRWSHKIPNTRWCHDPLAPPFIKPAIKWGHLLIHAAIGLPPGASHRPTAVTVAFEPVIGRRLKARKSKGGTPAKRGRPRKTEDPPPDESAAKVKTPPISTELAVQIIRRIRGWLDEFGVRRTLMVVVDGSYLNSTVVNGLPERTELVGRTRHDAKLFRPLPAKQGNHVYGERLDTPERIGTDPLGHPQVTKTFIYGCDLYPARYTDVHPVLWRNGTRSRPMRLLVLGPTRYGPKGDRSYRQPAFLLSTDLSSDPAMLLQCYLCRWQIEVVHRMLKQEVGLGQTQCRDSSAKIFAGITAAFALFTLACLRVGGDLRGPMYHELPKWQSEPRRRRELKRIKEGRPAPVYRATIRDNIALLRKGLHLHWRDGILRCS